jgi:hypothetical protein
MDVSGMAVRVMAIPRALALRIGLPNWLGTNHAIGLCRRRCGNEAGAFSAFGNMNLQGRTRRGCCGGFVGCSLEFDSKIIASMNNREIKIKNCSRALGVDGGPAPITISPQFQMQALWPK